VASDARLCVVSWIKRLMGLQPEKLDDPSRFLFTLSDGKVPSRDKVPKVPKEAAVRKGLEESNIGVTSLRAGVGGAPPCTTRASRSRNFSGAGGGRAAAGSATCTRAGPERGLAHGQGGLPAATASKDLAVLP